MSAEALAPERRVRALVRGAAAAAGVTALPFCLVHPIIGLVAFAWTIPFWFFAVLCMGPPIWAILHNAGVRGGLPFAMVGAAATLAGTSMLLHDLNVHLNMGVEYWPVLPLTLPGAVAGWVIQRVAYGSASSPA